MAEPSDTDVLLTRKLVEALALIDARVEPPDYWAGGADVVGGTGADVERSRSLEMHSHFGLSPN